VETLRNLETNKVDVYLGSDPNAANNERSDTTLPLFVDQ